MPVFRYTVRWAGFTGAPGFTNFHFSFDGVPSPAQLDAAATKTKTFLQNFAGLLPAGVTIAYPGLVDVMDETTGELTGEANVPVQTPTIGIASGNWSSAVGACVNWNTIGIRNGRRMRGRTFIVPLAMNAFAADGTLADTQRTAMIGWANTFIAPDSNVRFGIWGRPTLGQSDGVWAEVVGASVTDKTAVLRSRRD